jgi:hypothetical protein
MADGQQEFCLCWNNHQLNLVSSFHDLRKELDFVDVTLACEGQSLQAHKVNMLSTCQIINNLFKLDFFYYIISGCIGGLVCLQSIFSSYLYSKLFCIRKFNYLVITLFVYIFISRQHLAATL